MLKPLVAMVLSLWLISVSIVAPAQSLIEANDPQAILDIAKGFGSATLETDDYGDPVIEGRLEGILYRVIFNGCDDGKDCEFILFSSGWALDNNSISLDTINAWNYDANFGKAYLDDENDPILEMPVNLRYGVTRDNLDDTFDWWRAILIEFSATVVDDANNDNGKGTSTI